MSYVDLNSFYLVLICLFWHLYGGVNIYKTTPQEGVVVMGNEGMAFQRA
jgi:hypothetical protein